MKQQFTDQIGRVIQIDHPPQKIVSLVPSQTELLFELGLDDEVKGITYFCVYPQDKFKEKPKIGGTKKLKLDKIKQLDPDLIIGNKEENEREQVEELAQDYPVWISDVNDLDSALNMINYIAQLTGKMEKGQTISKEVEKGFKKLPKVDNLRTLYLIWRKPYMAVGGDSFIHYMLTHCGFNNVLKDQPRYPELTAENIQHLNPEIIMLSSEPYPFKDTHIKEFHELVPHARVQLVEGDMFSWYGSRLNKAVDYLRKLCSELNHTLTTQQ